jgi:hypothetical protein
LLVYRRGRRGGRLVHNIDARLVDLTEAFAPAIDTPSSPVQAAAAEGVTLKSPTERVPDVLMRLLCPFRPAEEVFVFLATGTVRWSNADKGYGLMKRRSTQPLPIRRKVRSCGGTAFAAKRAGRA